MTTLREAEPPMSEAEIIELWRYIHFKTVQSSIGDPPAAVKFARAIEKYHGIGTEETQHLLNNKLWADAKRWRALASLDYQDRMFYVCNFSLLPVLRKHLDDLNNGP